MHEAVILLELLKMLKITSPKLDARKESVISTGSITSKPDGKMVSIYKAPAGGSVFQSRKRLKVI